MYDTILSIMDIIDQRQTAFDKEKLIKEIGETALKNQIFSKIENEYQEGFEDGCFFGLVKAQVIIQRGGVDDTV